MTDRVSTEGLREALAAYSYVSDNFREAFTAGWNARAALRDTGPRPDSEIARRVARLAIEYVERGDAQWREAKDAYETDDDLDPAWVAFRDEVRRLAAQAARLSTPRTETSDD